MSQKIGLAFEGGGGKGAYQIGVWKALNEIGLDKYVAAVSGTSIGAMNAFLFAYGEYEFAERIWISLTRKLVFSNPEKNLFLLNDGQGFFSREGVKEIFSQLDFSRVNMKAMPCYATCLQVTNTNDMLKIVDFFGKIVAGSLTLTQVGNPLAYGSLLKYLMNSNNQVSHAIGSVLGLGKIRYFKLNQFSNDIKKEILLASSAIPIVFPETKIDGSYYIDGGLQDNMPIKPLIDEDCDVIFLVHCNRDTVVPSLYSSKKIIEIIPQETQDGIRGTFDFTRAGIIKRINQGYHDAMAIFDNVLPSLESLYNINIYNQSLDRALEQDKIADANYKKKSEKVDRKLDEYLKKMRRDHE